ncbi:MAG: hypothetical protein AAGI66_08585 [Cyanobacteria bacterium P01_H01_bin.74]
MPLFLSVLLVLGLVYHLFFRYETLPDPEYKGQYYEYDHLTGNTKKIALGNKTLTLRDNNIENTPEETGNYTFEDTTVSYTEPSSNDIVYDDEGLFASGDVKRGRVVKYAGQSVVADTTTTEAPASKNNNPRVLAYTKPAKQQRTGGSNTKTKPEKPSRLTKVKQSVKRFFNRKTSTKQNETVAKPVQRQAPLRESKPMVKQTNTVKTVVNAPPRIMMASRVHPVPLPQQRNVIRKITQSAPDEEDGSLYAVDKLDLNQDGLVERLIQDASLPYELWGFSIVKGEREIFYAAGKQLSFLKSRHHGWQDIEVNLGRQRVVYRYNPIQGSYEAI